MGLIASILGPQIKTSELLFLPNNEFAVADGGRGAAHPFHFDSAQLLIGFRLGLRNAQVGTVVLEDEQFTIGNDRGGDSAVHFVFQPVDLAGSQLHALVFAATGEIDVIFMDDGAAAVAHGDPVVGP